jgi:hypothetical protein
MNIVNVLDERGNAVNLFRTTSALLENSSCKPPLLRASGGGGGREGIDAAGAIRNAGGSVDGTLVFHEMMCSEIAESHPGTNANSFPSHQEIECLLSRNGNTAVLSVDNRGTATRGGRDSGC